jgi:hypothetical protein
MARRLVHGATPGAWRDAWCMARRLAHGATPGA